MSIIKRLIKLIGIGIVGVVLCVVLAGIFIAATGGSKRAELRASHAELQSEIQTLRAEMNAGFARIEAALKIHELEHHREGG
jgi:hypothetical protein